MLRGKQNESTARLWDPVVGGLQDPCPDLVPGNWDKERSATDCEIQAHPIATKHRYRILSSPLASPSVDCESSFVPLAAKSKRTNPRTFSKTTYLGRWMSIMDRKLRISRFFGSSVKRYRFKVETP